MSNRQARREQSRTTRTQRSRPRPQQRSSRPTGGGGGSNIFTTGFLLALGAVAVVLIAVVIIFTQFVGSDSGDGDLASKMEDARANLPLDLANGTKIGRDDAPVKIVEYEDAQCPFCLRYTANTEPTLMDEFVKTGKAQIEYKHLPILGKSESTLAAIAMTCAAEQNKFWEYHAHVFTIQAKAGQDTNEQVDVGRFTENKLKGYASDLGLDRAKFDACYQSPDTLATVSNNSREAQSFGITSTPGFIVNGRQIGSGSPSLDDWRAIINEAAGGGSATTTTTASPSASASASPSAAVTPSASASPSN